MRLEATILAIPLAAVLAAGATAESSLRAAPQSSVNELEEADPSAKKAHGVQKVAPAGKQAPALKASPMRKAVKSRGQTQTPMRSGLAQQSLPAQTALGVIACAPGFVRAIKPDHPHGYYECRLPAKPPCTEGYEPLTYPPESHFRYTCSDDWEEGVLHWAGEGLPQVCPPGWTLVGPGGDYGCRSSAFLCKAGYYVDGAGVHKLSDWRDHLYTYKCTAN